jgi:hypothetical protein
LCTGREKKTHEEALLLFLPELCLSVDLLLLLEEVLVDGLLRIHVPPRPVLHNNKIN